MRKFVRGEVPECLVSQWEEWGLAWERRRIDNSGAPFYWPTVGGSLLNQLLLPLLKAQTQDHCSFCDNFPVSPPSIDTIEHFRPKSRFPRHAFAWGNLYYCCMFCQQKSDDFHEALLQPDAPEYDFYKYFRWDFTLGTLEVNQLATPENQERARQTILIYGLNTRHPFLRRLAAKRRMQGPNDPIDEFAYRDFVEGPAGGGLEHENQT